MPEPGEIHDLDKLFSAKSVGGRMENDTIEDVGRKQVQEAILASQKLKPCIPLTAERLRALNLGRLKGRQSEAESESEDSEHRKVG